MAAARRESRALHGDARAMRRRAVRAALALAVLLVGIVDARAADSVQDAPARPVAEYATRWVPQHGTPQTLDAVVSALSSKASRQKPKTFAIQYHELAPRDDLPEGYKAILRRRQEGKTFEFTYKVRGPESGAASLPPLRCEGKDAELSEELDIAIHPSGQAAKRVFARSCTIESSSGTVPTEFGTDATPRACDVVMRRRTVPFGRLKQPEAARVAQANEIKIEEWTFGDRKRLLEISWKAEDSETSANLFRSIVASVLGTGTDSLAEENKETMSQHCGA